MDARTAAKRRLAALAAAFAAAAAVLLADPAGAADVRVETARLPSGPALPNAAAPSLPSLPSLPQALPAGAPLGAAAPNAAAPSGAAPSQPALRAAEAPRPAGASAGLQSVAASVQKEQAAPPAAEAAPSAASRSFFDGGGGLAARATAVVAAAATPGGLGMPAVYALSKYAGERSSRPAPEPAPWRDRVLEHLEGHAGLAAAGFVGLLARGFAAGSPFALALLAAGVAFGAAHGAEELIAKSRRVVVGGWQASHDQKYRVDPGTGQIKDIRGHKYGSDRYEAHEDGPVSAGERLYYRAAAAALGAGLLSIWSGPAALLFSVTLTVLFAGEDLLEARRPRPERAYSDEDRAHAARFRK